MLLEILFLVPFQKQNTENIEFMPGEFIETFIAQSLAKRNGQVRSSQRRTVSLPAKIFVIALWLQFLRDQSESCRS